MRTPTLRTARLVLDRVRPGDAELVAEYCVDPAISDAIPVPVPYTREHADGYVRDYANEADAAGDQTL
jgi:hypothetical protein